MKKICLLLSFILLISWNSKAQQAYHLIVGTNTKSGKSEGIYVYRFHAVNGESELKSVIKGVVNPTFLTLSTDNKFVYSITELSEGGSVNAYRLDHDRSELVLVNEATNKPGACHIAVSNNHAFTASYGKGSISAFGIERPTGELSPIKQLVQHTGKSIDPKRQTQARVHQVQFTPDKKYLVATDLGEDQVYLYAYKPDARGLTDGDVASANHILKLHKAVKVTPGSGPRHLTFSPNGKFAYLANEFTGVVMAYRYKDGDLQKIQEIGSTTPDFVGNIDAADIHVSPDGKFLYESNRGEANTISTYAIAADGRLTLVETISTQGKGPRNFVIDPSGRYLLVGNQYSNDIVVFERNKKTGTLKDTGKRIEVGAPVCLVFAPVK